MYCRSCDSHKDDYYEYQSGGYCLCLTCKIRKLDGEVSKLKVAIDKLLGKT